jgi:hypothetical protein
VTDMSSPFQNAGASFSGIATRSTAKRLRRTRQHLGSYRHDLIVAMRVVNNIEREMLRAEWENWLLDENTRCKQVQTMLRENRTNTPPSRRTKGADTKQGSDAPDWEKSGRLDELRTWQEEYCSSCSLEQSLLLEGRRHLAFR